jgi:hypothetical protein
VPTTSDRISLRVSGGIDPARISEPLVLSAGARAGIDVVRLQELVTAVEIAARSSPPGAAVTILIDVAPEGMTVSVRPVAGGRLEARLFFLRRLVGSVDIADGEATLHVGR